MPFNIQAFQSALVFGGVRQNLFQVMLPFPGVSGGAGFTPQFSFMCKAASLPPEQVSVIAVPYFGRQIKVPGDRTFPEWQVTVINDEDWNLRGTFESWSNAINAHFANIRNPAALLATGYQVKASVLQYGKSGNVVAEYDFINLWPSTVAPIDVAWESNDQIEDFQVTFEYDFWVSSSTS